MAAEDSPAFQFYPKDWLSSSRVMLMNLAEEGAYVRLLCIAWLSGSIPAEISELAKLCRVTTRQMRALWPAVSPCFVPHPTLSNRLVNERLEEERRKQSAFREMASERGAKGAQSRWKKHASSMEEAMPKQCPGIVQAMQKNGSSSPSSSPSSTSVSISSRHLRNSELAREEPEARNGARNEGLPEQFTLTPEEPALSPDSATVDRIWVAYTAGRARAMERLKLPPTPPPKLSAANRELVLGCLRKIQEQYDDAEQRFLDAMEHIPYDKYHLGRLPEWPGARLSPKDVFKINGKINNIEKLSEAGRAATADAAAFAAELMADPLVPFGPPIHPEPPPAEDEFEDMYYLVEPPKE